MSEFGSNRAGSFVEPASGFRGSNRVNKTTPKPAEAKAQGKEKAPAEKGKGKK